jgi:hypothetical protein
MKRTLILTADITGGADWEVKALQMQMADWITANKKLLSFEDLIIMPVRGDTKLYWLEGESTPEDLKSLEEIKDRLKPVLEIALDIKIDKQKLFKRPKGKTSNETKPKS